MKTTCPGKNKENYLDDEIFIKAGKSAFFVCILALLVFFSYTTPLGAHPLDLPTREDGRGNHDSASITAQDVAAGDMEEMKQFLLHIKNHVNQFIDYNTGLSPFEELLQQEGDWRNDTIYMFRMTGGGIIQDHPYYPFAKNGDLNNLPVMKNLISKVKENKDEIQCERYTLENEDRVACSVLFDLDLTGFRAPIILSAGLHHNIPDLSFSNIKCPHYIPETSAIDVVDEETLRKFMDEFTDFYVNLREVQGVFNVINLLTCFRILPWRYEATYLFAMIDHNRQVVVNANNPSLEKSRLNVVDENGCNVGDEIVRVINSQPRQCKDLGLLPENSKGFVQYLWDDPTDDVPPVVEEGKAPGDVPKLSYVKSIPVGSGPGLIIWGSGIYYPETERDDDGCAIAGSGNTPKNTIFNLFLTASILFSAALWRNRSRGKRGRKGVVMRNGAAISFVCVLALLVFFSGTRSAGAHDGDHEQSVTAGEVAVGDMEKMEEFVRHAKAHWESITTPDDNIEFERSLTAEGGDWNNGTIYLMVIDKDGTVFTHGDDPQAQNVTLAHYVGGGSIFGRPTMLHEEVQELIDAAQNGGGCVDYVLDNNRVACAVEFTHPVWQSSLILLAGYHHIHDEHAEDGVIFDRVQCPYFISEVIDQEPYFKQGIGANEVVDSATLKEFVNEFTKYFTEQIEINRDAAQLAKIRNCWRALPWRHGAVYVFIMTESNLVFFNGNGPHLENRSFDVRDRNECDVGNEVIRVARNQDAQCRDLGLLPDGSAGFVQYLWDDPTDDVPPRIEEGMAPGDVPKLSYVVSFSHADFLGGEKLIIGSGFHPEVSDDDGCAIAGGSSTTKSTLLNLLLIVSVLFGAAFWKSRSSSLG